MAAPPVVSLAIEEGDARRTVSLPGPRVWCELGPGGALVARTSPPGPGEAASAFVLAVGPAGVTLAAAGPALRIAGRACEAPRPLAAGEVLEVGTTRVRIVHQPAPDLAATVRRPTGRFPGPGAGGPEAGRPAPPSARLPAAEAPAAGDEAPAGAPRADEAEDAAAPAAQVRRIDRYEVLGTLGRGAFGAVFHARDPRLDRDVAVKVLAVPEARARERFVREAKAVARLRHPHVLAVHDWGEHQGRPFLVMDKVDGQDLAALAAPGRPLAPAQAAALGRDLARALAHAHGHGVLHRDVKPQNVLVERGGHAWLCDFGLAQVAGEGGDLTRTGAALGTPQYMSPEQAAGLGCDARSDVYGLGATLFHALTGRAPFEDQDNPYVAAVSTQAPRVGGLAPGTPPALEDVVARCLEKDPGARFQAAEDLARALEGCLAPPPAAAPTVSAAARWAGLVGLGLLVGLGAGLAARPRAAAAPGAAAPGDAAAPAPARGPEVDATTDPSRGEPRDLAPANDPAADLELVRRALDLAAGLGPGEAGPSAGSGLAGVPGDDVLRATLQRALAGAGDDPGLQAAVAALEDAVSARAHLEAARSLALRARPADEQLAELAAAERLAAPGAPTLAARATLERARVLARRGRPVEALDALAALGPAGGATEALADEVDLVWARAAQGLGRTDEARARLERLADRPAPTVAAHVARAALALLARAEEAALEAARRAVALAPGDRDAELALARALSPHEEATLEPVLAALARQPDDPLLHLALARALDSPVHRSRTGGAPSAAGVTAERALDRAIELGEPRPDPEALVLRASRGVQAQRWPDVRRDLDRALAQRPFDARALFLRALARDQAGDGEGAARDWQAAHAHSPARFEQMLGELSEPYRERILGAVGPPDLTLGALGPALEERLAARAARLEPEAREAARALLLDAARGCPWQVDPTWRRFTGRAGPDATLAARHQALVAAAPRAPRAALEGARVLVGRDLFEPALAEVARARALGAPAAALDWLEAQAHLRRGLAVEGARRLRALAAREPEGLEGRLAQAELHLLAGELAAARRTTRALLGARGEDGDAAVLLARILARSDPTEALRAALRAHELQGALDARLLLARAEARIFEMLPADADPSDPGTMRRLDQVRFRAANDAFMDHLGVTSGVEGRLLVADCYLRFPVTAPQVLALARLWIDDALRLEPERPQALWLQGLLRVRTGAPRAEVLAPWRAARALAPWLAPPPAAVAAYRDRFDGDPPLDGPAGR